MSYPGGKAGAGVFQKIINQIPPHRIYIEPFLGSGAVMRNKKPAAASIGIDIDAAVVEDWNNKYSQSGCIAIKGDAISFLKSYEWHGDEFVYCDPPYLFETRSCQRPIYTHEFGNKDDHIQLLDVLNKLPCSVALSGYPSSLYKLMAPGWRTITYQTVNRAGKAVKEWLWMNYAEPMELHDYRYLGNNFRERERLKRIKTRWVARLRRMEKLERYAVLSSIAEYSEMIMPSKASL